MTAIRGLERQLFGDGGDGGRSSTGILKNQDSTSSESLGLRFRFLDKQGALGMSAVNAGKSRMLVGVAI